MAKGGLTIITFVACYVVAILGAVQMFVETANEGFQNYNLIGISYLLFLTMLVVHSWPTRKKDGEDNSKESSLS